MNSWQRLHSSENGNCVAHCLSIARAVCGYDTWATALVKPDNGVSSLHWVMEQFCSMLPYHKVYAWGDVDAVPKAHNLLWMGNQFPTIDDNELSDATHLYLYVFSDSVEFGNANMVVGYPPLSYQNHIIKLVLAIEL